MVYSVALHNHPRAVNHDVHAILCDQHSSNQGEMGVHLSFSFCVLACLYPLVTSEHVCNVGSYVLPTEVKGQLLNRQQTLRTCWCCQWQATALSWKKIQQEFASYVKKIVPVGVANGHFKVDRLWLLSLWVLRQG